MIQFLIDDVVQYLLEDDHVVSKEVATLLKMEGLSEVSTVEFGIKYTWRKPK